MVDNCSDELINHIKNIDDYKHLVRFEIFNSSCDTYDKFQKNHDLLQGFYQDYGYQIYVENVYNKDTMIEFLDSYRIYNYNYYLLYNDLITTKRDFINKKKEEI